MSPRNPLLAELCTLVGLGVRVAFEPVGDGSVKCCLQTDRNQGFSGYGLDPWTALHFAVEDMEGPDHVEGDIGPECSACGSEIEGGACSECGKVAR